MLKMKSFVIAIAVVGLCASANAVTKLKMGMQASFGSVEYESALVLGRTLKELSNGEFELAIYPGAQLGDDRSMMQQLTLGDLDFTYAEFGRVGLWIPRAGAVLQPYVIKDYEHIRRVFDSPYGMDIRKEMLDKFQWRALDTWYNGTRQTTSNRPLNSIGDFKGLKLRVPNAKSLLSYAKYSGASATPMSFSEVYLALQTNAVDGQENPLPTINTMKFYEVQPYLAITNHVVNDAMVLISDLSWNKLTKSQQEIVTKAVKTAGSLHTKKVKDQEQVLVAFFEKQGVKVTYPDLAPFRQAMQPLYQEFDKQLDEPVIKKVQGI